MELPKRKSIRLKSYDYSSNGAYFVTICSHNRKKLFGEIVGGFPNANVALNEKGEIINKIINSISDKYQSIKIDKYVIMPNHVHLIVIIENVIGNPSPPEMLGNIIAWFKYQTTKEINQLQNITGAKLWQRSYHDHIIRNEHVYKNIWEYIDTNPLKWELDCYHIR